MLMYGLEELREAISNPHLILRELNRAYHRRLYTRPFNTAGIDIFDADWDNLIILDACRYDIFCEESEFDGIDSRQSRGAATPEFVRGNFSGKQLHDVVYATTNSWYFRLKDEIDTEVHAALYADQSEPSILTETTLEAAEDYPNKRLLIHFIPPHHPFEGPTAERVFPSYEKQSDALFKKIQRGEYDIDDETLRQAYVENLQWVLPEVNTLLSELDGKTVVTADHGELLGDRTDPLPIKDYGHHIGLYTDKLVTVPWYEETNGSRRRIVPESPVSDEAEIGQEKVDERLRELGYKV